MPRAAHSLYHLTTTTYRLPAGSSYRLRALSSTLQRCYSRLLPVTCLWLPTLYGDANRTDRCGLAAAELRCGTWFRLQLRRVTLTRITIYQPWLLCPTFAQREHIPDERYNTVNIRSARGNARTWRCVRYRLVPTPHLHPLPPF